MLKILSSLSAWARSVRVYLILSGALLTFFVFGQYVFYLWAYDRGHTICELASVKEVVKVQVNGKKSDDKINRDTPDGSDKRAAINWLLHYTAGNR